MVAADTVTETAVDVRVPPELSRATAVRLPLNFVLFSAYVFYLNRGRINVFRAFGNFLKWAREHPGRRKPIGQPAIAYIESCGGAVWK